MNKRAQFVESWVEYVAGAGLVLAFFLAARGAYVGVPYLVAVIAGGLLGRWWYSCLQRKTSTVALSVLTLGVLFGMILGSFGTDRRFIVILYVIALLLSHVAHKEKWIRTV